MTNTTLNSRETLKSFLNAFINDDASSGETLSKYLVAKTQHMAGLAENSMFNPGYMPPPNRKSGEPRVVSYKIKAGGGMSDLTAKAASDMVLLFAANQNVLTIEDIVYDKDSNTIEIIPLIASDMKPTESEHKELQRAWDKFDPEDEGLETMHEELITEAFRHIRGNRIFNLDHMGSVSDNPTGHKALVKAMKMLDKRVPMDMVYMYTIADKGFKRLNRENGVKTNSEAPTMIDLKTAGFSRTISGGTAFMTKADLPGVVYIVMDEVVSLIVAV